MHLENHMFGECWLKMDSPYSCTEGAFCAYNATRNTHAFFGPVAEKYISDLVDSWPLYMFFPQFSTIPLIGASAKFQGAQLQATEPLSPYKYRYY